MSTEKGNRILDDYNWRILEELQKNARITSVEIGKRINLSAPAVSERIRKLEDEGYIRGYRTVVDFDRLGLSVPVFIQFKGTRISHSEMLKLVDTMPEVVEWYGVTGSHCSLLKIVVSTTKKLEQVIEKLQEYGETSTSVILSGNPQPKIITRENL
jgi:Lrp/AsnC family leucine-responsive transcriptional regulator